MSENPFGDPFTDQSVTATISDYNPNTDDYNPFDNNAQQNQPAVLDPSGPPPPYTSKKPSSKTSSPVPRAKKEIPGHEELLRRQADLEKKAEELNRREREMASSSYHNKDNNWPPFPVWFPVGPCFYQDFGVDIPTEFQSLVKLLYYLWIAYVFVLLNNVFVCLAMYITNTRGGSQFGLALLWFLMFAPCSLCWYRPVYKAFRSDSSIHFFLFFFMMFFQFCFSVLMAVGIPYSGWAGWISAWDHFRHNIGVGIYAIIQAVLFSITAAASLILLKRVHTVYRSTGASFEKAQQEFATGVMKNPGVRTAATTAATSAAKDAMRSDFS